MLHVKIQTFHVKSADITRDIFNFMQPRQPFLYPKFCPIARIIDPFLPTKWLLQQLSEEDFSCNILILNVYAFLAIFAENPA